MQLGDGLGFFGGSCLLFRFFAHFVEQFLSAFGNLPGLICSFGLRFSMRRSIHKNERRRGKECDHQDHQNRLPMAFEERGLPLRNPESFEG
jgi:hypothetical protein